MWAKSEMRQSTDANTHRQKAQRAFSAVFLAPIDAVVACMEDDHSEGKMEDIAQHFEVSHMVIDRLLKNNHVIDRSDADFADAA